MIVYVNDRDEIKAVGTTDNESLTPVEINDDSNPFTTWSNERICCFRIWVENGEVLSYSPYVNTDIIDRLDELNKMNTATSKDVVDTQLGLAETYEKAVNTEGDVTDIELAITELYEMILGGV